MKDIFHKFFDRVSSPGAEEKPETSEEDVLIATCALLLEMSNIDGEFSESEKDNLMDIMRSEYDLSEEHAEEIQRISQQQLKESIHLWKFTDRINEKYNNEEKIRVIEMIWKIVFSDGQLNKHEDYLVHKLARLLNLTHRQLIDAKLAVREEMNGRNKI